MTSGEAIEMAKRAYPRCPWSDGVLVAVVGGETFVIVGRHRIHVRVDGSAQKTYRPTSGASRKARGW